MSLSASRHSLSSSSLVEYFTSKLFDDEASVLIKHGFFTRRGGTSTGVYDSLNCGRTVKDDAERVAERVAENRARAATALGISPFRLVGVKQVHSAIALVVDSTNIHSFQTETVEADAMVTCVPGIALGVLGADCAPVLFFDASRHVIGAAHAGWKGAVGGVLEATIEQMVTLGAQRASIQAAVGPCIGPKSYEVGPEFIEQFLAQDAENDAFFTPSERVGHAYFNLPEYIVRRLANAGVRASWIEQDTMGSSEDMFFSHRRATLTQEGDTGRQISIICMGESASC
mmetsp:Transcript_25661/g.42938  ORF Transcript_25661/g.42938 Transcript_25661/m.42938 type:complete len:286 (-) Transcript_25661:106-963(-)|eukprot:CAMPEP_0198211976 /NCGR_PEP_ID=MMETSP1445-20131203/25450_1 /TAXON_ID=36898 /ORGANISM="Pyramimonas sp., Strain CCMP2087" /LENGTH=285 /DNA_ID=CAMNT_0043886339 /DNA_START=342 /DNA_END=1199 /DNA_ORIENTATION=-